MPARRTHLAPSTAQSELAEALASLRAELELPGDFPAEALVEAESARAAEPAPGRDLRELPFVTLDPAGARDLDQAFVIEPRSGGGWLVRYAIADVPAFVRAGGAVDAEARRRGQSLYAADGMIPLHPPVIGVDRASLLPGEDRTAYVWSFELDAAGAVRRTELERALVRSRAQLDYESVQRAVDAGEHDGPLAELPAFGAARLEQERLRGGASLDLPDEEVVRDDHGGYRIERRLPLPVETWNAQLSIMTGIAAARLMLDGGVGVLRTMPAPDADAVAAFRTRTAALGLPWPQHLAYGEYLRALDRLDPRTGPVLRAAAALFRGAGYAVFDGAPPSDPGQAAIAAPYAHVTAPIRRLVDRWGLVASLAIAEGRPVPAWLRESLPELPALMQASATRASRLEQATLDRVEAALLADRVGEVFEATVVEVRSGERLIVQLDDPAVTANCAAPAGRAAPQAGERMPVVLEHADIRSGSIGFRPGGGAPLPS
ncbi:RNB domain-containing ribonuclease [Agromyces mediolanus]|uniref:RNB domain-containing ribonuclease n=1 Tax=Agromyces mediolanus TaxID=41986 RepID=UPI002041F437|nr:RNB domain-containing ribonuclease [Agromyces mediolanus]MCM3656687.1 RNB domain-containing ribonuclease [Agromyces mediolanus]